MLLNEHPPNFSGFQQFSCISGSHNVAGHLSAAVLFPASSSHLKIQVEFIAPINDTPFISQRGRENETNRMGGGAIPRTCSQ